MSECCAGADPGNGTCLDLVVIGAGSAGFSAAIRAAELGAQVALIGHGTIGGTCVNVGCVPSKTLIRATESLHQAEAASRFAGIRGGSTLESWRELIAQKDDLVSTLRKAKYSDILPAYNTIAYVEGAARIEGAGVKVGDQVFEPKRIMVTTGSAAVIPPIPGMADVPYLTSTTALDLDQLPASLVVIGGGYIGCELTQMFARASK